MSRKAAPRDERRLSVRGATTTTEVVVAAGCLGRLEATLEERFPRAKDAFFVVDRGVADAKVHRRWLGEWAPDPARTLVVPGGEAAKTRAVLEKVEDALLDAGLTRDDVVVAVGGGAVLDVTGFAASVVRRGLPWAAVPTSVVAQVDAAVGGKTAVNHPRGKNLLGTFHPPALAVADVSTLRTLPARDRTAGLAEVWKSGLVGDPGLLALLEERGARDDDAWWVEIVARSLAVKARFVEADERDVGARRALNYGHTVGHALETATAPDGLRHGEAVAIGMGVAAEVARGRGTLAAPWIEGQDRALALLGLPTRVPPEATPARLVAIALEDKKRRAGETLTMVLPRAHGGVSVAEDVSVAELEAAIRVRRDRRRTRRR
ncbi:MAG: 3-dehydroquinate synthase [Planctomycetes bacterium]|nr:3-dehydroquinate synthase [Planctomycetota bacterium]